MPTKTFNGVKYELYDAFRSRDSAIGNGQYYKDNGYLVRVYVRKGVPGGSLKYELYLKPKHQSRNILGIMRGY